MRERERGFEGEKWENYKIYVIISELREFWGWEDLRRNRDQEKEQRK